MLYKQCTHTDEVDGTRCHRPVLPMYRPYHCELHTALSDFKTPRTSSKVGTLRISGWAWVKAWVWRSSSCVSARLAPP